VVTINILTVQWVMVCVQKWKIKQILIGVSVKSLDSENIASMIHQLRLV